MEYRFLGIYNVCINWVLSNGSSPQCYKRILPTAMDSHVGLAAGVGSFRVCFSYHNCWDQRWANVKKIQGKYSTALFFIMIYY